MKNQYILWFEEIDQEETALVGGKGANLGEMVSFGLPVPPGFVVTAPAYFQFLKENQLERKIKQEVDQVELERPETISRASEKIKTMIKKGFIPSLVAKEVMFAYSQLGGIIKEAFVAVRSSATAEDLPSASFAGQQATFLNIKGESNVVKKVQECWASLFEPRAIFYRQKNNFDHLKVGMAVIIQKMVDAEISGVMFTIDPVNHQKNRIIIEAIYGLGELIVQGEVIPDRYVVEKNTLEIIKKEVAKQTVQLVKKGNSNKKVKLPLKLQLKRKLSDLQIKQLAKLGKKIHQHYFYPQDIEWAWAKKKFYILQTRPVTTLAKEGVKKQKEKKPKRKPILKGQAASPGIAVGEVRIIKTARQINQVKKGEILVAPMTSPDFVPAMKKVVAIVTDKGGQTSHAAIISREIGIPCVVGTQKATEILKNHQIITVNGSRGEVYKGGRKEKTPKVVGKKTISFFPSPSSLKTATKIYVNLGEPELAPKIAPKNVDGIGLLRAEFIIAQIGRHPKLIIKERKQKLFINKLSSKLSIFCEHFYPRPVVYRTTDFKTNEYRHLIGGKRFEPEEENPFLGFRGGYRYLADPEVFEMELKAIKKTREKFKNLWLMLPFVRTPHELKEIKKIIVSNGLFRSPSFKLWLMVEVPSNVILLEKFIKVGIDGVSIGSNDLTMLILGVDRDNAEVAPLFNEKNPAVLWAIKKTIKTCQKYRLTSSICGQAPSLYPELVEKLVKWGITSISVSPEAIEQTRELVYETEKKQAKKNG